MPDARETRDASGPDGAETPPERLNRNWTEILQELRVIQAGSQIITGFLLAVAFQERFKELSPTGYAIYFALLGTAIVTTVIGLTPVMVHRRLFRAGAKAPLVQLGNRLAAMALVGVGVTLAGIVLFIVQLVAGLEVGLIAAAAAIVVIALLWLLLPEDVRRRRDPKWATDDE